MKMKMVMEKSWNMKIWPKVMEFCYQIVNFTYLPLNCTKFVCFFATTKKLSINVESLGFLQNATNAKSIREMVMEN